MWFLESLLFIAARLLIFCPLLCIIIFVTKWRIHLSLNRRIDLFLWIEILIFILAAASAPLAFPKITSYLELYIAFFGIFPIMLFLKTRSLNLSYLYPLSGLMVFVAADIWEWGVFIFGSLGMFPFSMYSGQWFDQIHRIYAIGVLYVLLMLSEWKANRWSLSMLAATVIVPLFLLAANGFSGWEWIVRAITLLLMGFTVILGLNPRIEDSYIGLIKGEK